jgi:hypothetical protein
MASEKQMQANRRNALLSSGPVTPAGKAVSRMNALKTGIDAQSTIIRGEDPAALEELTRNYYERFQPQGQEECDLLDSAIRNSWLLRRLHKTEAEIWNASMAHTRKMEKQFGHPESAYPQGDVYGGEHTGKTLDRVHTRLAAVERALRVSLETLVKLRKSGLELPAPSVDPQPLTPNEPDLPSETDPQSPAPSPHSETNPISPLTPSHSEPLVPAAAVPNVEPMAPPPAAQPPNRVPGSWPPAPAA